MSSNSGSDLRQVVLKLTCPDIAWKLEKFSWNRRIALGWRKLRIKVNKYGRTERLVDTK